MTLDSMEKDVNRLEHRLHEWIKVHGHFKSTIDRIAANRQKAQEIETELEATMYSCRKKSLFRGKEASLLHWAGVYVDRIHSFLLNRNQTALESLWWQFLQCRLNLPPGQKIGLNPSSIRQISNRLKETARLEKQLSKAHNELTQTLRASSQSCQQMDLTLANLEAGQSLANAQRRTATLAYTEGGPTTRRRTDSEGVTNWFYTPSQINRSGPLA